MFLLIVEAWGRLVRLKAFEAEFADRCCGHVADVAMRHGLSLGEQMDFDNGSTLSR